MKKTYKKLRVDEVKATRENQKILKQLIFNNPKQESMQGVLDSVNTKIMKPRFQ